MLIKKVIVPPGLTEYRVRYFPPLELDLNASDSDAIPDMPRGEVLTSEYSFANKRFPAIKLPDGTFILPEYPNG